MADEYVRKEDVIDVAKKYFDMIGLNPEILVDSFITMPPADVAPVVHGKWIKQYRGQVNSICSVCGKEVGRITNFCSRCGTKMDG